MPLAAVLRQLGSLMGGKPVNDNEIALDNELCKGRMWGQELAPGIELVGWQMQLHQSLEFVRAAGGVEPVWAIMLTDSPNLQAYRDGSEQHQAQTSHPGSMAYLYNHHLTVNMFLQDTGPLHMLLIRLKSPVWEHILVHPPTGVESFINSTEAQFHGLGLDNKLLAHFDELINRSPACHHSPWSSLAKTLQICSEVFTQLEQRELPLQRGLRSSDASRLYRAHNLLISDFQQPLAVESICKTVGIGRDKFRKLFQQVYGTTPYQYFQQRRMEEAHRLIVSGEHSIMDVGYLVGYSHLGHFAQAFKKQFGYLPKDAKAL